VGCGRRLQVESPKSIERAQLNAKGTALSDLRSQVKKRLNSTARPNCGGKNEKKKGKKKKK